MKFLSAICDGRSPGPNPSWADRLNLPPNVSGRALGAYNPPLPRDPKRQTAGAVYELLRRVPEWLASQLRPITPDYDGWAWLDLENIESPIVRAAVLAAARAYAPRARWFFYQEPVGLRDGETPSEKLVFKSEHQWIGAAADAVSPAIFPQLGEHPEHFRARVGVAIEGADLAARAEDRPAVPIKPMISLWHFYSHVPTTEDLFLAGVEEAERMGVETMVLWADVSDDIQSGQIQGVLDAFYLVLNHPVSAS